MGDAMLRSHDHFEYYSFVHFCNGTGKCYSTSTVCFYLLLRLAPYPLTIWSASVDLASQSVLQIRSCIWLGLTVWELTGKKRLWVWEKPFVDSEWLCVEVNMVNRIFRCRSLFVVPEMLEQRYKVKFLSKSVCVLLSVIAPTIQSAS